MVKASSVAILRRRRVGALDGASWCSPVGRRVTDSRGHAAAAARKDEIRGDRTSAIDSGWRAGHRALTALAHDLAPATGIP